MQVVFGCNYFTLDITVFRRLARALEMVVIRKKREDYTKFFAEPQNIQKRKCFSKGDHNN